MAKQVILAVAGAGKTYHICHSINPSKRNLILAFTRENVLNIKREMIGAFGSIPKLTTISTYHSFVYHNFILPYEPSIAAHFGCRQFVSKGITTISPPSRCVKSDKGKRIPNIRYFAKDKLLHYVDRGLRYYCSTLSELALQVECEKESLVKRAARRLNLFYDAVYIDEFQDFRENDYDLLVRLAKLLNDVTLVGDYYQHSVSGQNNTGRPFANGKSEVGYSGFLEKLRKRGFELDLDSLRESRRCSPSVCSFVQEKLGIGMISFGGNAGKIAWVKDDVDGILANDKIVKLVYNNSDCYTFRSINWGYSKGDTFDSVCVILTKGLEGLANDDFSLEGISRSTINKLYVALTRSRGDVYLVRASDFDCRKDRYWRLP